MNETLEMTSTLIVESPLDGEMIASLTVTTDTEFDSILNNAIEAQKKWAILTLKERVQVFYNYLELLKETKQELAEIVHVENGKTMPEAVAEIEKSIELTEYTCSLPQVVRGDMQEVSNGVWCTTSYEPIGVVANIAPFNFPHMVPHWTAPNAMLLGNAVIMKPSEHVPLSAIKMKEMLEESGLPAGLFGLVHGDKKLVEKLCDSPIVKAVSFVGSTPVAKIVYARATSNFKRCVALGGAKNHLLVLPDCHPEMTANNVIASMSGCAGQRCMAASVMIAVGDVDPIINLMKKEAGRIKAGENLGAVINKDAKERIEKYIDLAEKEGAKILVDGRNTTVANKKNGHYVGVTIIDHVTKGMAVATEEIFGPVISIIRVKTIEEAIELENNSPFGNAAAVFTQSGKLASKIIGEFDAGMVGVNVGVPVPREPFSFAGWNDSKFGHGDLTGDASILFWSNLKKITTKWAAESKSNWMS
ncbi:MAG: CoA-acylating methylmalonate-semialdehyde dehydrogenase [Crocinitomicaceae bacterium]|nr:CoA-acylating methylmalonate-semialdehyde dehydrogenase [Crocinitomicaceae bacterium]